MSLNSFVDEGYIYKVRLERRIRKYSGELTNGYNRYEINEIH
jgi:hypothetical protein